MNGYKRFPKLLDIGFILGIIVGIIFLGIVYLDPSYERNKIDNESLINLRLYIEETYHDDEVSCIKIMLPNVIADSNVLSFYTSQEFVQVFLENELIYEFGKEHTQWFSGTPGAAWHFVKLSSEDEKKELVIQLSDPFANVKQSKIPILLGDKSATLFFLIHEYGLGFIVSCILLIIGGAVLVTHFLLRRVLSGNKVIFYLGMFTLFAALWTLAESNLLQIYLDQQLWVYNLTFVSMMLVPPAFLLFMKEAFVIRNRVVYYFLVGWSILNIFLAIGLQLLGWVNFAQSLFLTHFFLIVALFILLKIMIESLKEAKLKFRLTVIGCLSLIIGSALDIIRYYGEGFEDTAACIRVGLFIFIVAVAVDFITEMHRLLTEKMKMELLYKVAYRDGLTGVKNRASFQKEMDELNNSINGSLKPSILIIDLNDLKKVNDTMGHHVGDELIVMAAHFLQTIFREAGEVFRIGGDEFVIISPADKEQVLAKQMLKLEEELGDESYYCHGYKLSLAYGKATYCEAIDQDFYATMKRADKRMYEDKRKFKQRNRKN